MWGRGRETGTGAGWGGVGASHRIPSAPALTGVRHANRAHSHCHLYDETSRTLSCRSYAPTGWTALPPKYHTPWQDMSGWFRQRNYPEPGSATTPLSFPQKVTHSSSSGVSSHGPDRRKCQSSGVWRARPCGGSEVSEHEVPL